MTEELCLQLQAQLQQQKLVTHRDDIGGKFVCSVCKNVPTHSRIYYGIVFCTDCFHKYIWTPSNNVARMESSECSGDGLSDDDDLDKLENKVEKDKPSSDDKNSD